MRYNIIRTVLLIMYLSGLNINQSYGCDVCGCGITGTGIGMMTSYQNNYVRLAWQSARYKSVAVNSLGSEGYFQLVDISSRYYLTDRFKVSASIPYRINHRVNVSEDRYLHGLSDIRISGNYSWINNKMLANGSLLLFETGLGVKLPTGKYDPKIHQGNLPENFNIGQGNFSLLLEPAFVYDIYRWVFSINGTVQWNSPSSDDYQYGHQYVGNVSVYRNFDVGEVTLVPGIGMAAEYIGEDRFKTGQTPHGTGGSGSSLHAGMNIQIGRWLTGIQYAIPISQHYSGGESQSQDRMAIQLSYIF